jgi:hypothetical protein
MKNLFKDSFRIIRANRKAYLWINIIFYGTIIIGSILLWLFPYNRTQAHYNLLDTIRTAALSPVLDAYYLHRNIPLAIWLTFSTNLFAGSFLTITLPSLFIPFLGIAYAAFRAFAWGYSLGIGSFLSFLVMVLEGQGYVLAAFGAYLLAVRFLFPKKYGLESRKKAYIAGLKINGKIYILITGMLIVAACFEVTVSGTKVIFPNIVHSPADLGFTGTNIKMSYSGAYVYYDSTSVLKGDAKVVGTWLEDIRYFRPGDLNAARVLKTDTGYDIQLYLDKEYWRDEKISTVFLQLDKKLKELYMGRHYRIAAFCYDSLGTKRTRYF